MDIKHDCDNLRRDIKNLGGYLMNVKAGLTGDAEHPASKYQLQPVSDKGEMIANVMLAYRHLEDAAMRLGKVIQAWDGGVSVYDKDQGKGVE